jgi:glycosyltransferase involved in cell wall biosynthesis
MRILIISLVFPPETGAARRVGELAQSLSLIGHQVSVVTGFPSYPTGIVYRGYHKVLFKRERWENCIDLVRVYLYTSSQRKKFFHRLVHYLTFTFSSIMGGLLSHRPDVIYVVSPPYFLGISGWILSKFRRARLVLDVQDLWPAAPIALGYIKNRFAIKFLLGMETFIYTRSRLIFALSDVMKDRIYKRGVPLDKIKTIYNWVDLTKYKSVHADDLKIQLGIQDRFVILFAGNLGQAQGLESVIQTANLLKTHSDILFVFLGEGIEKPRLMDLVKSLHLSNVLFLDGVQEEQVPVYLGMADVLLATLGRAKHREAAVPSKIQTYMSSEKPLLLAIEGAAAQIVEQANCGIVVPPDDSDALAKAVLQLKNFSPFERKEMGRNGKAYAEQFFDREKQCLYISACLNEIVEAKIAINP